MLQSYLFLAYFVNALISLAEMWRKKMEAMKETARTTTTWGSLEGGGRQRGLGEGQLDTHTRHPGESSVYNLSMVLEEPPAPAARDDAGFAAALDGVARRLKVEKSLSEEHGERSALTRT